MHSRTPLKRSLSAELLSSPEQLQTVTKLDESALPRIC
jgi:hypothetical protein